MNENNPLAVLALVVFVLVLVAGGIGGCTYLWPKYNVYEQEMAGQAELTKAESTRKIAVLEAEAKKQSAQALADAEVIRASGVAKANEIIGKSLEGNDAYLRYLWIQGLESKQNEVIYVPTEANLPIMEAGRRATKVESP